jgi:hypothetical protein
MTRSCQKANNVELSIAPTPGGPGRGCGQFDEIETNREAIANAKAAIRETFRFSTALFQRTFKRRPEKRSSGDTRRRRQLSEALSKAELLVLVRP